MSSATLQGDTPVESFFNIVETETLALFEHLSFEFLLEFDVFAPAKEGQLVALDYVTAGEVASFWPAVLVVFGLSVVAGRFRRRTTAVDDAQIDLLALFGANERRATVREFVGGDLMALFGGVELDLRDTEVTMPPARINATALFGAIDITVPREWNVHMDVLPILGAAEDARLNREGEHEEVDLVVTGFTAFGAVSVTD